MNFRKTTLKLIVSLLLVTLSQMAIGQIHVINADSLKLGETAGTNGIAFYGNPYFKNIGLGKLSDSVLVRQADGKIKFMPRSLMFGSGGGGAVASVFGRTGAITATSGDYSSFYYPLNGNPGGFLTSVPAQSFASLTGKPTTLSGYGITDAASNVNVVHTIGNEQINGVKIFNDGINSAGINSTGNIISSGYFDNGGFIRGATLVAKPPYLPYQISSYFSNGEGVKIGWSFFDGNNYKELLWLPSSSNNRLLWGPDYIPLMSDISAKQNLITLTTTGSGAATFNQSTGSLNIPIPAGYVDLVSSQYVGGNKYFNNDVGVTGSFSVGNFFSIDGPSKQFSFRGNQVFFGNNIGTSAQILTDNLSSTKIRGRFVLNTYDNGAIAGFALLPPQNDNQGATYYFPSTNGNSANIAIREDLQNYFASGDGTSTSIIIPHGRINISTSSPVIVTARNSVSAGFTYCLVDSTNVTIVYPVAPPSGTSNLFYSILLRP